MEVAMKKRIDPQHYITDALITSDEWDSFDYKLRLEIEELEHIDYDSTPIDWKKNTLAFGYLYHVEKLLDEKCQCGDHEFENIRELQTLIKKYDHLKTFLLTVRIATIAYRAGLIPKFITEGEEHLKYRDRQREKAELPRGHDGKDPAEIQTRNNQIREHFQKAHIKNPSLTISGFAEKHAARYRLKSRRVRDILKMAVGN
jgi:hypothetical protein